MSEHKDSNERVFTWARFATPIIVGICSSFLTAYGNWRVLEAKFSALEGRVVKTELRLDSFDAERTRDAERYGEIRAKLDALQSSVEKIRR